eukprot:XP_014003334.1 PREDICTED: histidine ammonia-lyase-like [Salmo salar]
MPTLYSSGGPKRSSSCYGAACQGIEFFHPLLTTTPLEKVYDLVRSVTKYRMEFLPESRPISPTAFSSPWKRVRLE